MIISPVAQLDRSTESPNEIDFKLALTREERESAFRLIYRSYLRAGLTTENDEQIRITPYNLQASTAMFVAKVREEVVSTVSLVCDDELGLPLGKIYADEVQRRRSMGIRMGEVTCLADRRKHMARRLSLLIGLFRIMVQYARHQGLNQLLVAVHPRHAAFYRRYLAFEQVGDERAYEAVLDNPAVALCLDFDQIDRERPANYDKFFAVPVPEKQLTPQPMSPEDHAYFSAMLQRCERAKRRVG